MSVPRRAGGRAEASRSTGRLELAGIAALGGIVGAATALWSAGEVAGLLTSHSWPPAGPSSALGIAVRILLSPGHPSRAWPPAAAGGIPGAGPVYGILGGELVVVIVLCWSLLAIYRRAGAGASLRRLSPRSAAWASRHDLRPLEVAAAEPGRLVLGRSGRHLLASERHQSVIVVGPTQSHKTSGFAVPTILEWAGPVLATSVKADLLSETLAWRRSRGKVWVFDPASSTGLPSDRWSPLAGASTWVGARRMASGMTATARSDGLVDGDFWFATAAKLLAPLLFAAAGSGRSISDVVAWIDTQEVGEVADLLEEIGEQDAIRAAWATWRREERQRSSVYTTAETVLEAFADPPDASLAGRDIDPESLLDGGHHTLYVCSPSHEQHRLRPAFAGLVHHVLTTAYERVTHTATPLDPGLLVVMDEAANVAPLRDLDALAATAAGHGVQLVTVWQDMSQISARYGPRAATVVNNHRAKVVLSGISDPATLDHVSSLIGDEELAVSSTTRDGSGGRSTTESPTARRLAPADSLRRIRPGHGVLVYGHLPPARLRLRPWFQDGGLARRARGGGGRDMKGGSVFLPWSAVGRRRRWGRDLMVRTKR